jgi:inner membrane protein
VDNLTHSLVGLASAKAGLGRLSPYATSVCVVSANIADADVVALVFGDRWTLLHHHRGITHSILGTIAIGFLVPLVAFAAERVIVKVRKRSPRIRLRGLLVASLIAAATHPLLDWANNYGVRPLLPWSGRWFYGDLVFIVDPYIWLLLGVVVFPLTSNSKLKVIGWSVLGLGITTFIGLAGRRSGPDGASLRIAFVIWIVGLALLGTIRAFKGPKLLSNSAIFVALCLLMIYWGGLASFHTAAVVSTSKVARMIASSRSEHVLRVVAMPVVANPFQWQSIAETERALYRFKVDQSSNTDTDIPAFVRYEKPTGPGAQLVSLAERDRRAQILLDFARFPIARVDADNCVGQALVQFADLRYTEPGVSRGNFSVNIPVDCPAP